MARIPDRTIVDTQMRLQTLGYDPKWVDGLWGPASETAFRNMYNELRKEYTAWGTKFTPEELRVLQAVLKDGKFAGGVDESDLMSAIAFETGTTFDPKIQNKVSKATGLIQFMPAIARAYGTSADELMKMSIAEQLHYVGVHFKPYAKRLRNLGDVYMSILWPRAVGMEDDYILWSVGTTAYKQNQGLDLNKDGKVTREECLHKIKNMMVRGFDPAVRRARSEWELPAKKKKSK